MLHRQPDLAQEFSSMFAHHMDANNVFLFPRQNQLDKPGGSALSLCAVNTGPREGENAHLPMLLFSFFRRETNTRCFWISEGTPGDYSVVDLFLANWKQGIPDGNAGLIRRYVRKKMLANDITYSKNMGYRCSKIPINVNSFRIKSNGGSLQV